MRIFASEGIISSVVPMRLITWVGFSISLFTAEVLHRKDSLESRKMRSPSDALEQVTRALLGDRPATQVIE